MLQWSESRLILFFLFMDMICHWYKMGNHNLLKTPKKISSNLCVNSSSWLFDDLNFKSVLMEDEIDVQMHSNGLRPKPSQCKIAARNISGSWSEVCLSTVEIKNFCKIFLSSFRRLSHCYLGFRDIKRNQFWSWSCKFILSSLFFC